MGDLEVTSGASVTWADRRVLITGAGGFLGSWLARSLAERGAAVTGIDIRPEPWGVLQPGDELERVVGDIRDDGRVAALVAKRRIDVVIHLAAQALVGAANADPVTTFEHNIKGTWQVLEACRTTPSVEAVVVASSDKAYGDAGGVGYVEDLPLMGRHPYDASKVCTDVLAQTYAHSFDLPVVITRCGNLYGGGDLHWNRIVPETINAILAGSRPLIRSDGTPVRDYLYVEDAVSGVVRIAEAVLTGSLHAGEAFNLAGEARLTVLDLVGKIMKLLDCAFEPEITNEAVNEIADQRVSSAKARAALGWAPAYSLDEGLKSTVEWYREYLGVER